MNCNLVLSRLHAYVDGELPQNFMLEIEEHLGVCPSCQSRVEHLRRIGDTLDSLAVPALPRQFSVRVMAEARRRVTLAKKKKFISPSEWQTVRWILDLSFSMRLAACAVVFLAFFLGIFMSKGLFMSGNTRTAAVHSESLEGFEWFGSTPPSTIGAAYLTLALAPTGEPEAK